MASLGAQLRQAREKRGVTLEDISQSTKIGTRLLRAIEEEQFDQLPGGIFNKGFVRAYARTVGIDEDQAIADYLAATEPRAPEGPSDAQVLGRIAELRSEADRKPAGEIPWGTLALLLALTALGFAAWGVYSRETRNPDKSASTNPVPVQTAPAPTEKTSLTEPVPSKVTPANPPASPATTNNGTNSATTAVSNPSAQIATTPSTYFNVRLKVRQDCWMSVSSDGKVVLEGMILAPAQKSVRAKNQIVVKAGSVGALDFEFNGESLPPQGNLTEVKTLTFGSEGLETVQTVTPTTATPTTAIPQP